MFRLKNIQIRNCSIFKKHSYYENVQVQMSNLKLFKFKQNTTENKRKENRKEKKTNQKKREGRALLRTLNGPAQWLDRHAVRVTFAAEGGN